MSLSQMKNREEVVDLTYLGKVIDSKGENREERRKKKE